MLLLIGLQMLWPSYRLRRLRSSRTSSLLLYNLDSRRSAAIVSPHSGLAQSDDSFLYNRAAVIAAGPGAYETVRSDPAKIVDYMEVDCESLLYVAQRAFERVTGSEWTHESPLSYETGSNSEKWS